MVTKGKDHGLWMRWREVQESYANRWRDSAAEPRSGNATADAGHRQRERPRAHHAHCAFGTPLFAAKQRSESSGGIDEEMARTERPLVVALALVVITVIALGVVG